MTKGFKNWAKALAKFKKHEQAYAHKSAFLQQSGEKQSIAAKICGHLKADARECLLSILSCLRYLARQGLGLRGHESDEGNLKQFLQLQSSISTNHKLQAWCNKNHDYTSSAIQNEMLSVIANAILRHIITNINKSTLLIFSGIVDGRRDMSGIEQESICVRYVDDGLNPVEVFGNVRSWDNNRANDI